MVEKNENTNSKPESIYYTSVIASDRQWLRGHRDAHLFESSKATRFDLNSPESQRFSFGFKPGCFRCSTPTRQRNAPVGGLVLITNIARVGGM
jgi:hypothetical protein